MAKQESTEVKPILYCGWCGTRLREDRAGCPRGPACTVEQAEDTRLSRMVDRAGRETARTIGRDR